MGGGGGGGGGISIPGGGGGGRPAGGGGISIPGGGGGRPATGGINIPGGGNSGVKVQPNVPRATTPNVPNVTNNPRVNPAPNNQLPNLGQSNPRIPNVNPNPQNLGKPVVPNTNNAVNNALGNANNALNNALNKSGNNPANNFGINRGNNTNLNNNLNGNNLRGPNSTTIFGNTGNRATNALINQSLGMNVYNRNNFNNPAFRASVNQNNYRGWNNYSNYGRYNWYRGPVYNPYGWYGGFFGIGYGLGNNYGYGGPGYGWGFGYGNGYGWGTSNLLYRQRLRLVLQPLLCKHLRRLQLRPADLGDDHSGAAIASRAVGLGSSSSRHLRTANIKTLWTLSTARFKPSQTIRCCTSSVR